MPAMAPCCSPASTPGAVGRRAARAARRGARLPARGRQPAAVRRLLRAATRSSTCPAVVDALSTGRVLTTELADGRPVRRAASSWSQHERDLAGETIYRFVFRSLYRMHAFNGDPHPGNYLFRPRRPGDVPRLRPGQAVHAAETASCSRSPSTPRCQPRRAERLRQPSRAPASSPPGAPVQRRAEWSSSSATSTSRPGDGEYTFTPDYAVQAVPGATCRPARPVREILKCRQPRPDVPDPPADQPRPLRRARRPRRHGQLAPDRRGAVANPRPALNPTRGRRGGVVARDRRSSLKVFTAPGRSPGWCRAGRPGSPRRPARSRPWCS